MPERSEWLLAEGGAKRNPRYRDAHRDAKNANITCLVGNFRVILFLSKYLISCEPQFAASLLCLPFKIRQLATNQKRSSIICWLCLPFKIRQLATLKMSTLTTLMLCLPFKIRQLATTEECNYLEEMLCLPFKIRQLATNLIK